MANRAGNTWFTARDGTDGSRLPQLSGRGRRHRHTPVARQSRHRRQCRTGADTASAGSGRYAARRFVAGLSSTDVSWSLDPQPWFDAPTSHRIRLLPGSHHDRLDAASRATLTSQVFHVGNDSNRVGIRLDGPRLALSDPLELISEGVVTGTMQLPPGGQPIIMGCEHPVTGGYPRIGQVAAVDLPVLAQCRPGDTVTFEWIEQTQAMDLLATRERALEQLLDNIRTRRDNA